MAAVAVVVPGVSLPPAAARRGRRGWARRALRSWLAIVGVGLVGMIALLAVAAPWITPVPYDRASFGEAWQFPSATHWFGTDGVGRDFYTRGVYGARLSLVVGITPQALAPAVRLPLWL